MADDQFSSGNWWDNTSRNTITATPALVSTTLNSVASFGWPTKMVEMKSSSLDSGQAALHDGQDKSATSGGIGTGSVLANNLQMMGLGLSSQSLDWNQALIIQGEKAEGSFSSMLEDDMGSSNFLEAGPMASSQEHWRQKLYSGGASSVDSSTNEYKQINRGFSLDQPQFSSHVSSKSNDNSLTSQQNLTASFQVNHVASYAMLLPENQHHPGYESQPMNYLYPHGANDIETMSSLNKFPQFLSEQAPPTTTVGGNHLQFSNNTPFWNASTSMNDGRSSFFPGLQNSIPVSPSFDEKTKNTSEVRDTGRTSKKSSTEIMSNKRPRNERPSSLPVFKVRKEKMGDRITALQQLVSPFGKTDTASVLSEAIEYIKFLHEQVGVLSTPYMKNGDQIQHQQNFDESKDHPHQQNLRSRGLCLVPVSNTFPVTHYQTTVDLWTPTFGETYQ